VRAVPSACDDLRAMRDRHQAPVVDDVRCSKECVAGFSAH